MKAKINLKKKIVSVFCVLALVISMSACGENTSSGSESNSKANSESTDKVSSENNTEVNSETESAYPVTVTDQAGRSVTIEKEPETIISSYYISTSMVVALGQQDKLVGVENEPGKRPIYSLSAPDILDLPELGTVKEFDLEKCASLNPDLVILPMKLKDMATSLEQLNIPVIFVMPETQELFEESIKLLGTALGCEGKADELLSFIDTNLSEMEDAVKDEEKPRVYLSGNSDFLLTAGPEMYQNNLIVNAGGENVAKDLSDTYWASTSYEQILSWDPEYIILVSDASYSVDDVLSDKNLAECTAVKSGNVYKMPNDIESFDSPVPASILGNLWLASTLHPEKYSVENYNNALKEFYETFYGFTPEQ